MLQTFLISLTALESLQTVTNLVAKRLFSSLDYHFWFLYLDVLVFEDKDWVKIHLHIWLDHIVVNISINSMQWRQTITSLLIKALILRNWIFLRLVFTLNEIDFTFFNIRNLKRQVNLCFLIIYNSFNYVYLVFIRLGSFFALNSAVFIFALICWIIINLLNRLLNFDV